MASVIASIQIESVFDLFLKHGWDVVARGSGNNVTIQLRGEGQAYEATAETFAQAYEKIVAQENAVVGVSTEGAAWAAESGRHA